MEENKFNHQFKVNDIENESTQDDYISFKSKLESVQSFPDLYTFKFIIPNNEEKLAELRKVLPDEEFLHKSSKTGKYNSITVKKWMQNADEVINIYKQISTIKEVIML